MEGKIAFTPEELNFVVKIISDRTKRRIIRALLGHSETHPMYHNEIFRAIGGSKSTMGNALLELVSDGILKTEWMPLDTGAEVNPQRLVKVFRIKKEHQKLFERCRALLEEESSE